MPSSLFKSWTTPEKREEENELLGTLFLEKMTVISKGQKSGKAKDRRVAKQRTEEWVWLIKILVC